jgi:cbb3-type cytochrome oxidase subunit 3
MGSSEDEEATKPKWGALIGVLLLVGLFVAGLWWANNYEPETTADRAAKYEPSAADAERMCQENVKGKLKSPASATFGGVRSLISDDFDTDEWTVTGWVDAENSFGANLRTDWTCEAVHTGGGNWRTRTVLDD